MDIHFCFLSQLAYNSEILSKFALFQTSKPKGRFFWLPLAKYMKRPILQQTKRTVPLVCVLLNDL